MALRQRLKARLTAIHGFHEACLDDECAFYTSRAPPSGLTRVCTNPVAMMLEWQDALVSLRSTASCTCTEACGKGAGGGPRLLYSGKSWLQFKNGWAVTKSSLSLVFYSSWFCCPTGFSVMRHPHPLTPVLSCSFLLTLFIFHTVDWN